MCASSSSDGVIWAREDALGAAVAVEMLDLPAGQSEKIESFVEMTKFEANPLKVAALRAQLQFTLAKVRGRCRRMDIANMRGWCYCRCVCGPCQGEGAV